MQRIIEIIVSPKGEAVIQTKGFAGSDCLQASKWLEQALGLSTTDTKTAEFHQAADQQQHQQNQA